MYFYIKNKSGAVSMNIELLCRGMVESNCYGLISGDEVVIVDAGAYPDVLEATLERRGLKLKAVLLTHGHFDHVLSIGFIKDKYDVPVYIHENDAEMLTDGRKNAYSVFFRGEWDGVEADVLLKDGDKIEFFGEEIEVLQYDGGRNIDTLALLHEKFPCEWSFGKRGARIRDKLHLEYGERFEWPDMEACDRGNEVFCYGLKDHFGVLCDGSVIPCCLDREGAITLGNLFDEGVTAEEILSSPRALAMRKGFTERRATEELCRKCGYARRFG